jgi:hypothetical protein
MTALLLPILLAACGPRGELFFANEAPTGVPDVGLVPAAPVTGDALQVDVRGHATDPEADAVTLRFHWTVDGVPVSDLKGPLVPAGRIRRGETWAVTVTPTDGRLDGPPAAAEVVVGNGGPTLAAVRLTPAAPKAGDAVELAIEASDPEDDPLRLDVTWTVDGHEVDVDDPLRLVAELVRGDEVAVSVAVADDEVTTEARSATVTVGNTPPSTPGIAITPAEPRPYRDDVVCRVVVPAVDPDGDRITTRLTWERDGAPFTDALEDVGVSVIPADRALGDHAWRCFAQASDGASTSERVEVAVTDRSAGVGEAFTHVVVRATAALDLEVDDPDALCGEPSCDCTAELQGAGELLYADHDQVVYRGTWAGVGGDCAPWFDSARTVADLWLVPPGDPYLAVAYDQDLSHVTGVRVFDDLHADRAPTSTPAVLALPADVPAPLSASATGTTTAVALGEAGADGTATITWTVTPSP